MALDASEILGSRQIAAVKVNPRGMGKRVAAPYAGMYGGVAAGVAGSLVGGAVSAGATMQADKGKLAAASASRRRSSAGSPTSWRPRTRSRLST